MATLELISGRALSDRAAGAGKRVLVQFSSPGCGHCRVIAGAVERIAAEAGSPVELLRIDTDRDFELAERWNILSSPTLVFLRDGREVDRMYGPPVPETLSRRIRELTDGEGAAA